MTVLEEKRDTECKSVRSAFRGEARDVLRHGNRPETQVGFARESELYVERTDISFEDIAGDLVRIRVTIHNRGAQTSGPTTVHLQSAPLGAFVPWKPLAVLPVRALQPGESLDVMTEATRPRPTPLGSFDRVPPKTLLTALNTPEQPLSHDIGFEAALNDWILRHRSAWRGRRQSMPQEVQAFSRLNRGRALLPPDLMELLGRPNKYWAGNIEVFVGSRAVERHFARETRIYPGRTNLASLVVGAPERWDAYAFELVGLGPDWEAKLFDRTTNGSLLVKPSDAPIGEKQWLKTRGWMPLTLAVTPPVTCQEGNLQVHVMQQSTGKNAIVEFNLNPAAKGLGCYTAS